MLEVTSVDEERMVNQVHLASRLAPGGRVALTVEEAAELIGVSERSFRDHLLPRCPKLYVGRCVRIPIRLFERYVEQLAQEEEGEEKATAGEILDRLDLRSR